jgi:hypothetical protein
MNVDAKTMKKIAMDGCAREIKTIEDMICDRAMKGKLSLPLNELSQAAKTHFEDNGFEVIVTITSNSSLYTIKWLKDYDS